jgi:acetylornithine deacetylase/succinyl-diaminopimelate desuccinylase-like protein
MKFKELEIPELNLTIRGTLNIGVIQGGTQYNNVADRCSLYLDRRMVPGETQTSCLDEIRSLLADLANEDPQFKAVAQISRPDWHWEEIRQRGLNPAYTPVASPVVQAMRAAHQAVCGSEIALGYTNGYMDMDFMVNGLGIPTVNYGPGEPGESHTQHEQLRIDQLLAATRVYAVTALQLAGRTG